MRALRNEVGVAGGTTKSASYTEFGDLIVRGAGWRYISRGVHGPIFGGLRPQAKQAIGCTFSDDHRDTAHAFE